jgi:hypothetical protein
MAAPLSELPMVGLILFASSRLIVAWFQAVQSFQALSTYKVHLINTETVAHAAAIQRS